MSRIRGSKTAKRTERLRKLRRLHRKLELIVAHIAALELETSSGDAVARFAGESRCLRSEAERLVTMFGLIPAESDELESVESEQFIMSREADAKRRV